MHNRNLLMKKRAKNQAKPESSSGKALFPRQHAVLSVATVHPTAGIIPGMDSSSDTRFPLRLHVLGSGSKGNAAIIENTAAAQGVLVDCGLCKRDFLARCAEAGFDPAALAAVLITHEHTDHTKGLGVVLRALAKQGVRPLLLTSPAVREASAPLNEVLGQGLCAFAPFGAGDTLQLGGMDIRVFATSHDAVESFGFRFQCGADAVGYMTDTGIATAEARAALAGVRVLALEANHDRAMLEAGDYPYHLKVRIASDKGHLSNDQAAAALADLAHSGLQTVVAMHVSQNNNTYRLPREVLEAALRKLGYPGAVKVAFQERLVSV